MAIRPRTLPAALAPVIVGAAIAWRDGLFRAGPALAALGGALLLQIGANLANDYFDHQRGIDTAERLGPPRMAASGLLTPAELRKGLILVIGLAMLTGLYLVWAGGLPILLLGLAAILGLLAYSGGPFPLASHGLGDLFTFIFFGLVAVGGTYYAQARAFDARVLALAAPTGFLITAILVVNNLRDIPTDSQTGKRTLAVMLGVEGTRREFALLLILAYLGPGLFWLAGWIGWGAVLPLLSLALAWPLLRAVYVQQGRALNPLLADTARLALVFSLLLALGLLLP